MLVILGVLAAGCDVGIVVAIVVMGCRSGRRILLLRHNAGAVAVFVSLPLLLLSLSALMFLLLLLLRLVILALMSGFGEGILDNFFLCSHFYTTRSEQ